MNAPFPSPTTLKRHKFTIDDVRAMSEAGQLPKRAVLLDGEIYDMPEDGERHINHAMRIAANIIRAIDAEKYFVGVQTTLRLSKHNAPSPDIYVLADGPPQGIVPAERILLVVEVADTSLNDDLTDSASRYARHAVRDYWVVDVNARAIVIHRTPHDGAYQSIARVEASQIAQALLIPDLAIALDHVVPEA
jgi:Uma2 family endonuclease